MNDNAQSIGSPPQGQLEGAIEVVQSVYGPDACRDHLDAVVAVLTAIRADYTDAARGAR